ncbi:MAG: hypothetical protein AAF202_13370, partial [Pseudomonadota bacterium]
MDIGRAYSSELIQEFVDDCLRFEHWQKSSDELLCELKELTAKLVKLKLIGESVAVDMPVTSTQYVEIRNAKDFASMLKVRMQEHNPKENHLIPLDRGRMLALSLLSDGDLLAEIYRPSARVESGNLKLLSPTTQLRYDRHMDLSQDCRQKLALNGLQTLFFRKGDGTFHGRTVQAHLFKMVGSLET